MQDIGYYPTYLDVRSDRNDVDAKIFDVLAKPDVITLAFDLITAVVGYKAVSVLLPGKKISDASL